MLTVARRDLQIRGLQKVYLVVNVGKMKVIPVSSTYTYDGHSIKFLCYILHSLPSSHV